MRCAVCDHIWQRDLAITATYDADYVAQRYDTYDTNDAMAMLRLGFVQALQPRSVLDYGFGNGAFIRAAERAGLDAFGVDEHGQYEKYFVRQGAPFTRHYDVITFFDVLEHFVDPWGVISQLDCHSVVVTIPNRPTRFPGAAWKHYRPGEHLHYFSARSIVDLFKRCGYRLSTYISLEDVIRGRDTEGANTMTYVFTRV